MQNRKRFFEKQLFLNWDTFLAMVLPGGFKINTVEEAIEYQRRADADPLISDLCRLVVKEEEISQPLLDKIAHQTLSSLHTCAQLCAQAQGVIKAKVQKIFHDHDFQRWRENHFKDFLKQKRKEEKENKKYPRPYIEYLDQMEKKLFNEFWTAHRFLFLDRYFTGQIRFSPDPSLKIYLDCLEQAEESIPLEKLEFPLAMEYLKAMHPFNELSHPLKGRYRTLRNYNKEQTGKDLASAFYPLYGFGYGRSLAYRQSTPAGSVFKLVIAYEALKEKYEQTKNMLHLNPFTVIDDYKGQILGYHTNGESIMRNYKGGRLPKSSHTNIGKVDLIGAIEQSSNIYFSILASEVIQDPSHLLEATRHFGYGQKSGIELPGEIGGSLPSDLAQNLTGLYAFAIGQHSLVVTPLQNAVMLSAIANGGEVLKPKIVQVIAGKEPTEQIDLLFSSSNYPFKDNLDLLGIHFPLFTEALGDFQKSYVSFSQKEVKQRLFYPKEIRNTLLEGMRRVVSGAKGSARPTAIRPFFQDGKEFKDFLEIQNQWIGKTGTAEIMYKSTIDPDVKAQIENHVWFGGILYDTPVDSAFLSEPELVVTVYLRFGGWGKEAAPLAAQVAKKWREIRAKHGCSSYLEQYQNK